MQLILKPVSDARLQEIIVTDSRFAIGRNEGHFKDYDRSIVEKLSRRHARIFERDGQIFVADLGSSNGTTVNGQNVGGEPLQLRLQDEVQFGGLRYKVEHLVGEDVAARSETTTDARIILQPVRKDIGLSPIVVSRFPYLVGRYGNVFASQQDSSSQQLAQISKKHAHFFLQEGAVHIEDLGSTNGTFVSGVRLSEQSRELVNGDTVAFGGDFFAYEVQAYVGRETIAKTDARIGRLGEGTIFVDDATNFFEIYMGVDDDEASESADPKATAIRDMRDAESRRPRFRFLRGVRDSLRSSAPVDRRLRWTFNLAAVAVILGLAGYWYVAWPVQQTSRLVDRGQYRDAAASANRYLRQRPGDERLQALATEAVLKAFIPQWQAAMAAGDLQAASRILDEARALGSDNPDDDEAFAALDFAMRAAAIELDGGRDGLSIDALADDESAARLVREWDARRTENSRALTRVELHVDGFDAYQSDFYRQLRELREWIRSAEPVEDLRVALTAALGDRDTAKLGEIVREFAEQYPDTNGLERLQEDLRRYETVEDEVQSKQWLTAFDRLNEADFHTAPFAAYARQMSAEVLPDADTRARYAEALEAWNAGEAVQSFDMLEELEQQRWGEDAGRMLERNRRLLGAVVDLEEIRDAPDFEERLFALYAELDPESDAFLRNTLQPDFRQHSESALVRADDRLRAAQEAWTGYESSGRLEMEHRLDETVSAEYRDLAGQLTRAYRLLRESEGIYRQLDTAVPETWSTLNEQVVQEIKEQTRLIGNQLVIDADIRKAKLDLLPDIAGS